MPDAVVLNLKVGPVEGLTLLQRIKAMHRGTPVFMLTESAQLEAAITAMKMGASDVLQKPVDTDHLLNSVRDGLRRDVHLSPVHRGRRPIEVRGFAQLTPREREVLQLISNGQSSKEAGLELGISPRTVEVHRARVMEKLGAPQHCRSHAHCLGRLTFTIGTARLAPFRITSANPARLPSRRS